MLNSIFKIQISIASLLSLTFLIAGLVLYFYSKSENRELFAEINKIKRANFLLAVEDPLKPQFIRISSNIFRVYLPKSDTKYVMKCDAGGKNGPTPFPLQSGEQEIVLELDLIDGEEYDGKKHHRSLSSTRNPLPESMVYSIAINGEHKFKWEVSSPEFAISNIARGSSRFGPRPNEYQMPGKFPFTILETYSYISDAVTSKPTTKKKIDEIIWIESVAR